MSYSTSTTKSHAQSCPQASRATRCQRIVSRTEFMKRNDTGSSAMKPQRRIARNTKPTRKQSLVSSSSQGTSPIAVRHAQTREDILKVGVQILRLARNRNPIHRHLHRLRARNRATRLCCGGRLVLKTPTPSLETRTKVTRPTLHPPNPDVLHSTTAVAARRVRPKTNTRQVVATRAIPMYVSSYGVVDGRSRMLIGNVSPAQTAMRCQRVSNMLLVGCVRRREVRNGGGRWTSYVNVVVLL
jgi:hypothetical protein